MNSFARPDPPTEQASAEGGLEFRDYRKEKPPAAGWYVWRLPHNFLREVYLIFLAEYRIRGAGYTDVLSPEFDHWDGYNVLIPKGKIEWAEYTGKPPKIGHGLLEVVGAINAPCPFCKKVPKWRFGNRSTPNAANSFYLECCDWVNGSKIRMGNPLDLARKRNDVLGFTSEFSNTIKAV